MLRIQRVLANGEQTEGTIAYSDKEGLPRSYESIREELATVYGQRVELGVLHDGVELDLYPSVWSILVHPGTTLTVKASIGLGTALSGRNTPRSPPTPYEQVGQVSDAYTIAQRLEALAELGTDAPLPRSPRSSRRDRHGQASSAPESPRLESNAFNSPPTSRPRSLVGPLAAGSAFTSLSSSWPHLGAERQTSPQNAFSATVALARPHDTEQEAQSIASCDGRAGSRSGSTKDLRRASAGLPQLVNQHFDDIGEWGGDSDVPRAVYATGVVTGHDYAMARSKLPKPKRPECDTASSGPSRYDSATPQTPVTTKAYSAPVSAVERIEDDDTFRRVRTQTDLRALATTRLRPRPPLEPSSASFPPAPPLTNLAASRFSSLAPASNPFVRKSSMAVLPTAVPRPEQLRLTSLGRRTPTPPAIREPERPSYLEMSNRSRSPL